jgi:hypothetical protein
MNNVSFTFENATLASLTFAAQKFCSKKIAMLSAEAIIGLLTLLLMCTSAGKYLIRLAEARRKVSYQFPSRKKGTNKIPDTELAIDSPLHSQRSFRLCSLTIPESRLEAGTVYYEVVFISSNIIDGFYQCRPDLQRQREVVIVSTSLS